MRLNHLIQFSHLKSYNFFFQRKVAIKFDSFVLIEQKLTFTCKKVANAYIIDELDNCLGNLSNNFAKNIVF